MAKERIIDLQETKGSFQLRGIVTGMEKEKAFRKIRTKNDRDMRMLHFGITYKPDETAYVDFSGTAQDNAYFYKRPENKGEKGVTQKVAWADRFKFNKDGFKLIGINVGVKKITNENGTISNDNKTLTDFDACQEIYNNLSDGASVFTKGNLTFDSYEDKSGNKCCTTKFEPTQISLCKTGIDFDADDFEPNAHFTQTIIFMGINPEKDDKDANTGRYIVDAKIVTYSTIEDTQFIIEDVKLANMFRKKLKPYNAINVHGDISNVIPTEEIEDDDEWGESNKMERVTAQTKRELIIKGAKGSTVDTETYTRDSVESAMAKIARMNQAKNSYADDSEPSDEDWGEIDNDINDEESEWD